MKDYTVVKFNGEKALRSNCYKLKGEYFEINVDIFDVMHNGVRKWLKKDDKNLFYDLDIKKYVADFSPPPQILRLAQHLRKVPKAPGRYIIKDVGRQLVTKYFNHKWEEGVFKGGNVSFITKDLAKTMRYDKDTRLYYEDDSILRSREYSSLYKNLQYGYEFNKYMFAKWREKKKTAIDDLSLGYSYGVEIETCSGVVPGKTMLEQGFVPARDGSTRNYEYVTKPFKQISSLIPIVETLKNTCEFDVTNSLHCHIGNVPTNKEFITKFYTLMVNIQDQVYRMFPYYKFTNVNKIKRKNYTQPLKSHKDFDSILTFLNNNSVCKYEYKGNYITHIADKTRTHKWDISSR